jgi:hypothetical protein
MNAQLVEGLKRWKAGEFERHVQRYVDSDHNPDSLENRRRIPEYFSQPTRPPMKDGDEQVVRPRAKNTFSWKYWCSAMGLRAA